MGEDWSVSHDFFYQLGGAERVTAVLANQVLPKARVLALSGRAGVTAELGLKQVEYVGGRGYSAKNYRQRSLLAPYELAVRKPIDGNILASSYAFSHLTRCTGSTYVYCHSPLRQIWSGRDMYSSSSKLVNSGLNLVAPALRHLDRRAARRARAYIANSSVVADRIREYYGVQPLGVIPPPVDNRFFGSFGTASDRDNRVVFAGRLVEPYKKVRLLLESVRDTRYQLIVAGTGRDEMYLKSIAPSNVTFVGQKSPSELAELYSKCKFLVFPSEDDFGMVPVEAMASGTPVLALGRGGALETVVAESTGLFFSEPTVQALRRGLDQMSVRQWDHNAIQQRAELFSVARFVNQVRDALSLNIGGLGPTV